MSHPARDIIVIGGSLGGLEALRTIVRELPADFGAALLVVLHTTETGPKVLPAILAMDCRLPSSYPIEGQAIAAGQIYLASPGSHLEIVAPGFIHLSHGPKVKHTRPAADRLFISAAAVYGPRVIGVVLSGGDGDGTEGARAIEQVGGLVIVQAPHTAKDPSMPTNVLLHDHPDYCLPAAEMATLLIALVRTGIQ